MRFKGMNGERSGKLKKGLKRLGKLNRNVKSF